MSKEDAMNQQSPLPRHIAARGIAQCIGTTAALLARGRVHLPHEHVGRRLHFADGTSACVYRETVVDRGPTAHPCVLVVEFRLQLVRGWGHAIFRAESLLNTPLFVGFPGFVSKLWLAHDEHGVYRGVYEWDGEARAEYYARCLWRILELGCVPGSIHFMVLPGVRRDEAVEHPGVLESQASAAPAAWWRLVRAA